MEVTYRDDVYDLEVGEFIAFSSEFVPSAQGTMGVLNATGYVLKAARSWKTPTTTYTLFLYGYLTATNKISVISSSGRVREVINDTTIRIDVNVYTPPVALARPGAPTTDAASFKQSLDRFLGKALPLQLLDQYGTPYFVTALLTGVDLANDYLEFDGDQFAGAKVGDVIVIADAAVVQAQSPEGLPLGMHFCAPWGEEARLLELAFEIEQAHPWRRITG